MIPKELLLVLVVAGASLLALWIDARFPTVSPRRKQLLFLHVLLAIAALRAAPAVMATIPGAGRDPGPATLALLGVFMPAMGYAVLSALWIMRAAQGLLFRT